MHIVGIQHVAFTRNSFSTLAHYSLHHTFGLMDIYVAYHDRSSGHSQDLSASLTDSISGTCNNSDLPCQVK